MLVDILPEPIIANLGVIALLVIGFFVEKHYVSRLTVFSNSIALTLHLHMVNNPNLVTSLYADIGLILGVTGLFAYVVNKELGGYYYIPTYFLYSSVTVGLVIVLPNQLAWILVALVIGSFVNYYLLEMWKDLAVPIA